MRKIILTIVSLCLVFAAIAISSIKTNTEKSITPNNTQIINFESTSQLTTYLKDRNVDEKNSEDYDVCVLLALKDPAIEEGVDLFAGNIKVNDDDDVNILLKEHRAKVKEYYTTYNEQMVKILGLSKYNYYASLYSPYIEVSFDSLREYEKNENDLIAAIENNKDVVCSASNYIVFKSAVPEANVDGENDYTLYPLTDAFSDIGVLNIESTGDGIRVGILDNSIPNTLNHLHNGTYTVLGFGEGDAHSAVISAIIGGMDGMAGDVYFVFKGETGQLFKDCEELINKYNVNIINCSLAFTTVGRYTNYDACLDNIISTTGCTVVTSAGNTSGIITAPGCSLNAITVGSINSSKNISDFSSWQVNDNFLLKPDVVAPGGYLNGFEYLDGGENIHYGTSYASPMVVGVIALLMEEFVDLMTNPALVKSVLHLGAEKLPSQNGYFDQQAGFGLVNYTNMRSYLLSSNYEYFAIPQSGTNGNLAFSLDVEIPYLDQIVINANSIINSNVTNSDGTTILTPSYTNYAIKIWNYYTQSYVALSEQNSNVDYLIFTNENSNNTSYRIDIVLESNNISGKIENGCLIYRIIAHPHQYDIFEPYTSVQHKMSCVCGTYITQDHVIMNGACILCGQVHTHEFHWKYFSATQHIEKCVCGIIGTQKRPHVLNANDTGRFRMCLECNAAIDINMGGGFINSAKVRVSANGSYIMSNGIIVLVDEDIEAYFNDELVFYDPNDDLEAS